MLYENPLSASNWTLRSFCHPADLLPLQSPEGCKRTEEGSMKGLKDRQSMQEFLS